MKHIKDFIQLYIGCEVTVCAEKENGGKINLGLYYPEVWTKEGNLEPNGIDVFYPDTKKVYAMNFNQVQLILRPMSDMTESERLNCLRMFDEQHDTWIGGAKRTQFLLQQRFDLFGLIEAELAIDATKTKEPA